MHAIPMLVFLQSFLNPVLTVASMQGTLQKFLDDLFQAVLSIPQDRPPLAVKYFFDFLEEQADKRGISDPDTLHIWKTNRYRGAPAVRESRSGFSCCAWRG